MFSLSLHYTTLHYTTLTPYYKFFRRFFHCKQFFIILYFLAESQFFNKLYCTKLIISYKNVILANTLLMWIFYPITIKTGVKVYESK